MSFLRILIVIAVLMIISVILQFATVPFSAVHNSFEVMESVDRSLRGLILGGLIWSAVRLIRGEQNTPEFSRVIFSIGVFYLLAQAIYDLLAR